ncbi:MAG: alpha/beta hydrolase [Acidimicrobiia bacterium]|jgi:pimeloyl-ACP methyl ester carboxylesterase
MPPLPTAEFIDVGDRSLHVRSIEGRSSETPLVFLHEGLGSVDLWRDFPSLVVAQSGYCGFLYSRYGNGWSTPLTEPRRPRYMHEEALDVLPQVMRGIDAGPPVLIGHSDGASIAIIYAGAGHPVRGLVLIAPHVFVEPKAIRAIGELRDTFPDSELPEKMAKYHSAPEATFRGWADIWLSPVFRSWNIEAYLDGVRCPTLVIQGEADEYGTTRQLDAVDAGLAVPARRLMVPEAEHSPHLSHMDMVTEAVADFIVSLSP